MPFSSFELQFQSSELAVRTALGDLIDGLRPLGLNGEEAGTVELVVAEALNNVVEHAYPDGSPKGQIRIACDHDADGLVLTIIDQGKEMPAGQLPRGKAADIDVAFEDLPEGGFGWFLIRDLAKDVNYERAGWENRLSLRLDVGRHVA